MFHLGILLLLTCGVIGVAVASMFLCDCIQSRRSPVIYYLLEGVSDKSPRVRCDGAETFVPAGKVIRGFQIVNIPPGKEARVEVYDYHNHQDITTESCNGGSAFLLDPEEFLEMARGASFRVTCSVGSKECVVVQLIATTKSDVPVIHHHQTTFPGGRI